MTKLSLNKAAQHAGVAKTTILEALKTTDLTKKLSGEKNGKGHWEIDTAELERVFPKTSPDQSGELAIYPQENQQKPPHSSVLEAELKVLREQIVRMDETSAREREAAADQIENLRGQIERQSADHRQALAAITDQRESAPEPRKGLWARLRG
jgi:hypothetical protein